jgi:hypothetical protein
MNPPQKWFNNKPPMIQPCPITKKRKSRWETKFEKDYPFVQWTPRDLSIKFMIPIDVIRPLMENKEECIKYIYLRPIIPPTTGF